MLLPDVNVLVYAFRADMARHGEYRQWLERLLAGDAAYGMADEVLCGFLRLVTNPRVFAQPDDLDSAMAFVQAVRDQPQCVRISPGPRHWSVFAGLCREVGAKGNIIPDAWFAALAIESGSEWISADRDYARFPGLRWRHPLA
jgi:toxin-antitoxin system PIN domain toxin